MSTEKIDYFNSEFSIFKGIHHILFKGIFTKEEIEEIERHALNIFDIASKGAFSVEEVGANFVYHVMNKMASIYHATHPLMAGISNLGDLVYKDVIINEVKRVETLSGVSKNVIHKHHKEDDITKYIAKISNSDVAGLALLFVYRAGTKRPFTPIDTTRYGGWETPNLSNTFFCTTVAHKRDHRIIKDLSTGNIYKTDGIWLMTPSKNELGWDIDFYKTQIKESEAFRSELFDVRHFTNGNMTEEVLVHPNLQLAISFVEDKAQMPFTPSAGEPIKFPSTHTFGYEDCKLALTIIRTYLVQDNLEEHPTLIGMEDLAYLVDKDLPGLQETAVKLYRQLHTDKERNEVRINDVESIFAFNDLATPLERVKINNLICFIFWSIGRTTKVTFGENHIETYGPVNEGVGVHIGHVMYSDNQIPVHRIAGLRHQSEILAEKKTPYFMFKAVPKFVENRFEIGSHINFFLDETTREVKFLSWRELLF